MEFDNIECVSSSDGMEEEEATTHLHHPFSKPHSNHTNISSSIAPATSVHELLECPVCTNSMYPPIHQVLHFSVFFFPLLVSGVEFFCLFLLGMVGFVDLGNGFDWDLKLMENAR